MAEDAIEPVGEDGAATGPARAAWIGAGALLATLALVGLIVMITWSSRARDEALSWERRANEVVLLARTIDASIARAEAALGRYVLDEEQRTGTVYYNEWRTAGWQIGQLERLARGEPAQAARAAELRALFERRHAELAPAARLAEGRRGYGGTGALYAAARSETLPQLRAKLEEIARAERANLSERVAATQGLVARADAFTEWLGWLAVLIAAAAVGLSVLAWRAFAESVRARGEAQSSAERADELEEKVGERTRALSEANARLQDEMAERAAAEERLRQVQKMEAVGQLTGGIAHDFNNMLAVVVGGLDLAKRKLRSSKREVELHLDNAMEGATRAAALTRRLLAFARAEPLLPVASNPAALVEGMLELIDRAIGERITIATRFTADPWLVFADPVQLENAILNLAVNARDAMDGAGELAIAIDNVALAAGAVDDLGAGDYVRLAVSDTGRGIPPEHLDRVFEPFFTTKPVGKGTGLGLSQIFGFARQSGGHVAIDSAVGRGTIVTLYLPRAEAAAAAAPRPVADDSAEPARMHEGAAILVVEDDPRVSRSTVAALEELGYRPRAAASGGEALERLEGGDAPDLLLTDVMMPEMTGTELAQAVRRLYPGLPILFVTGYVGEAGEAGEFAGAQLLRKPFTVAALASAVEAALGPGLSGWRHASAGEAAE